MAKKLDAIFGADGKYSNEDDLRRVCIPTTCTAIASNAFAKSVIIELNIPSSIREIQSDAFDYTVIKRLMIQDLESWCNIKFGNACSSPLQFTIARIYIGDEEVSYIDIPQTITELKPFVFWGWYVLKYVNLPNTIKTIGERAFCCCSSLKSVIIPESVEALHMMAFNNCGDLKAVVLPSELSNIEAKAFRKCYHLSSVISLNPCPPKVDEDPDEKDREEWCFSNSESCTLYVPVGAANAYAEAIGWKRFNKVVELEPAALDEMVNQLAAEQDAAMKGSADHSHGEASNVPYLAKEFQYQGINYKVTSPNTCRVISAESSIEDVEIPSTAIDEEGVAYAVTEITACAFMGCADLETLEIPDSVTKIGEYAFYECSGLISVDIPNSVTEIREYAFSKCSSITDLFIPDSITEICDHTFADCTSLETLEIPKSVAKIGEGAFYGCNQLSEVSIHRRFPPEVDDYAFDQVEQCDLIVPRGSYDDYANYFDWNSDNIWEK
jgi:hypothetical protein